MKSTFERISNQVKDKKTFILSGLVILFVVTIYLIRGGDDEFSLFMEALGILVVFFCAILVPLIGIALSLAGLLIYKVIKIMSMLLLRLNLINLSMELTVLLIVHHFMLSKLQKALSICQMAAFLFYTILAILMSSLNLTITQLH